ncbi:MAG: PIG-L deacetylase family protein [Thermoflexales bacterium]
MRKLLAIFAHPDDESFGPGGSLAKYAANGVAVHYLCGTRGEAGTVDARQLNGYTSVAELRTAELMRAADALGLASVRFLGYHDSGMACPEGADPAILCAAPLDEVAQRIIGFLDQLNPDAVITHDRFGGYGHPDHIKLHQAVLRAYELRYGARWSLGADGLIRLACDMPAPRLYFTVIPRGWLKVAVRLLPLLGQDPRRFGRNHDIDLVRIASWEMPITTWVDVRRYIEHKQRASACHASQQPLGRQSWLARLIFRRAQTTECFSRAWPPFQPRERRETGLLGD